MAQTDYEIIQICLQGNQDAFSDIIQRYQKLIYTVVYRMVNDKEEANDITQETFIKIYRSLDKYNPEYKFSTWAVKIATNMCLDVLRKKKLHTVSVDEMIHIPSSEETPESSYVQNETRQQIYTAIHSLPDKYRILVILFHEQGLSYNEICNVIGEPLSIVKNRLHRARHMLRNKLSHVREEWIL